MGNQAFWHRGPHRPCGQNRDPSTRLHWVTASTKCWRNGTKELVQHSPSDRMTGATLVLRPTLGRHVGRLVLACIDASESKSKRNLNHFSTSRRFALFWTAPNSEFFWGSSMFLILQFQILSNYQCRDFRSKLSFFAVLLMKMSLHFTNRLEIL